MTRPALIAAENDAAAARARLIATLAEMQQRLSPRALLQDAWEEVRNHSELLAEEAVGLALRRPVVTGIAAIGIIAFLARTPLWSVIRPLFFDDHAT